MLLLQQLDTAQQPTRILLGPTTSHLVLAWLFYEQNALSLCQVCPRPAKPNVEQGDMKMKLFELLFSALGSDVAASLTRSPHMRTTEYWGPFWCP